MIQLNLDRRKGLEKLRQDHPKKSRDFLNALGITVTDEWKLSLQQTKRGGTPGRHGHVPSLPGNPPAIDTGTLINSLRYELARNGIDFHGMEYALYLNDSALANRPFIEPGFELVRAHKLNGLMRKYLG